jgi:hypothetical protein
LLSTDRAARDAREPTEDFNMAESAAGARRIATPRFPERLQFRCPPALTKMLATAADREMTTASDYVRRAVASRLRADGYQLREQAAAKIAS